MVERLKISYAELLLVRANNTTYYTEDPGKYQAIVIQPDNQVAMVCDLNKQNDRPSVALFEANIKGTATLVNNLDEAIAKEIGVTPAPAP